MTPEQRDLAQRTLAKWPEAAADLAQVILTATLTENADVGTSVEAWCAEHPVNDDTDWMVAVKASRHETLPLATRVHATALVDYLIAAGAPPPIATQFVSEIDGAGLRMRWGTDGKWPYVVISVMNDSLVVNTRCYHGEGMPMLVETLEHIFPSAKVPA